MAAEVLPIEQMKERVGQEIGVGEWFVVDQEQFVSCCHRADCGP